MRNRKFKWITKKIIILTQNQRGNHNNKAANLYEMNNIEKQSFSFAFSQYARCSWFQTQHAVTPHRCILQSVDWSIVVYCIGRILYVDGLTYIFFPGTPKFWDTPYRVYTDVYTKSFGLWLWERKHLLSSHRRQPDLLLATLELECLLSKDIRRWWMWRQGLDLDAFVQGYIPVYDFWFPVEHCRPIFDFAHADSRHGFTSDCFLRWFSWFICLLRPRKFRILTFGYLSLWGAPAKAGGYVEPPQRLVITKWK